MTLTYATITLDLPHVVSKKGRRAVTNALKELLGKMNVSLLDMSGEYPKEATIALAFLTPDDASAHKKLEKIETLLATRFPDIDATIDYETA